MSVNINVVGRLGEDCRTIQANGNQFISFRFAVNDRTKEDKNNTAWFNVNSNQVNLASYLTKGKLINVIGTESVSQYTSKDGQIRIERTIHASAIEFISVGNGQNNSNATEQQMTTGTFNPNASQQQMQPNQQYYGQQQTFNPNAPSQQQRFSPNTNVQQPVQSMQAPQQHPYMPNTNVQQAPQMAAPSPQPQYASAQKADDLPF